MKKRSPSSSAARWMRGLLGFAVVNLFRDKIIIKIELSTICRQLKVKVPDSKMRFTDCAITEHMHLVEENIFLA